MAELDPQPVRPSEAVRHAASRLGLVWRPNTGRGRTGERLGRSLGSSAEFSEHRTYAPGDDVRHIDWRAYARSDQLVVRRFREEIAPRLDIVLDPSRSLAVDRSKARTAVDLAALWLDLGRDAGFATRLYSAQALPRPLGREELAEHGVRFDGTVPLMGAFGALRGLAAGGVRVVISDWMTPASPQDLFAAAFARATAGLAIAVWGADELEPALDGALRLVDAESGAEREVDFDGPRRARFVARTTRWRAELAEGARQAGVPFVEWFAPAEGAEPDADALSEAARARLGPLGLVAAR